MIRSVASMISAINSRSRCIQRPCLRDDLVAQQSMYRLLGDEVDRASEELGEVVLQVVDCEAELGAGGENIEQVDVAVATRLASPRTVEPNTASSASP